MRPSLRAHRRHTSGCGLRCAIIAVLVGLVCKVAFAGSAAAGTPADSLAEPDATPTFSAGLLLEALWYVPLVGIQFSLAERFLALDFTATTLIAVSSAQLGVRVRTGANGPYLYARGGIIGIVGVGGGPACSDCSTGPASGKRVDCGLGLPLQRRSGRRWFAELGGLAVWNQDGEVTGALRTCVGYAFR